MSFFKKLTFYNRYLKNGKLRKKDLKQFGVSADNLWADLVSNQVIDDDGSLSALFLTIAKPHDLPLEHYSDAEKRRIFNLMYGRYRFSTRYLVKEWVEPLLIAVVLALIIRTFVVQAFKIPTGSMRMTLLEGDRILVNKFVYDFSEPQRGDVIVFKFPEDRKRDFIKRLIALPGETVEIREGKILINGEVIDEPAIIRNTYYYNRPDAQFGQVGQRVVVPEGQYFVLGDNSGQSLDSRYGGFVPAKDVRGKALCIYWPVKRWRAIR
jgi:signal peptidase I